MKWIPCTERLPKVKRKYYNAICGTARIPCTLYADIDEKMKNDEGEPVDLSLYQWLDESPATTLSDEEVKKDIADIMRENITFSPQVDGWVCHGAINKIIQYFSARSSAGEGVLVEALKEILAEKRNAGEFVDKWAFNRCWHIADKALASYQSSGKDGWVSKGVEAIKHERERQIKVEGWDYSHDEDYDAGQLIGAAGCYVANALSKLLQDIRLTNQSPLAKFQIYSAEATEDVQVNQDYRIKGKTPGWEDAWPWDSKWDKREKHNTLRSLVIAGALIAAEIDRITALPSPPKNH